MALVPRGVIDLPPHAQGGFDHGDVHVQSGRVYVAHTANGTLEVLQGERGLHETTLPGCPEASGVRCAQQEGWVFAAARRAGTVLIIDAMSGRPIRQVPAGTKPNGLAWDPRRKRLLVTDVADASARLLDPTTGGVLAVVGLPGRPRWCAYDPGAARFLVNVRDPACVTILGADTAERVAIWSCSVSGPHGLDLDLEGRRAFVACDGGALLALDLETGRELGTGAIPGAPDAIWYNPVRDCLYVAIGDPGLIAIIESLLRFRRSAMTGRHHRSFLFAMFHGGGNVHLILPIVRRLAARGHEVRVLAGPRIWAARPPPTETFLEAVTTAGASATPLPLPKVGPHDTAPAVRGLLRGWTPSRLSRARNLGVASRWSSVWAEAMASELQRTRADVVVADYFLLGAIAAAERAGVPVAVLVHNAMYPAPLPGLPPPGTGFDRARNPLDHARDRVWAAALRWVAARDSLPLLNRTRIQLGLAPLRSPFDQYQVAARVLVLGSRSFDFPAHRLPDNVRYVGTPLDDTPASPWESPWPADDPRHLVLVSLSTLDQGQGPVMHRAIAAVAQLPVRALVTLGPALAAAHFAAPPNARIEAFVPHAAVLPSAAAVVTQCGLSTVAKALAHGVPMVCIPVAADQPDNAARVVACGAGVRLSSGASIGEIRSAIERVLADGRFREAARRMAAAMALENGAVLATDELEALPEYHDLQPQGTIGSMAGNASTTRRTSP